jgi:tetratricopeptide (TPR) repeat protein
MGEVYYNTILNRGICYKNLRLFDEAIVCYDNAIEINSKDPSGHFNKAMCLLKKIYGLSKLNFSLVKKKLCEEAQKSL